jgi:hypothetical protein
MENPAMGTDLDPVVGNWYRHLDKGQMFRVTGVDEETGTIEIQHFDGDLEEIDSADWPDLEIEPAAEPEDWTGPSDDVETDDLGYTETDMDAEEWREPLDEIRSASPQQRWDAQGEDEEEEAAEDESQE